MEDANYNDKYDPGERIWFNRDPYPVKFKDGRSKILNIHLDKKTILPEEEARGLAKIRKGHSYLEVKGTGQVPIQIGELADLSNPPGWSSGCGAWDKAGSGRYSVLG